MAKKYEPICTNLGFDTIHSCSVCECDGELKPDCISCKRETGTSNPYDDCAYHGCAELRNGVCTWDYEGYHKKNGNICHEFR